MMEDTIAYHLHAKGDSRQVVLLHGAAGTRLSWPAQVRRLHGCRVYALDLPGHGKSAGDACSSIAAYAWQVLRWMDAMDFRQTVLVGHSMGSAIAMQVALVEPARVAALVLVGSATRLKVNPALMNLAASQDTYHQAIERLVAWSFSRHAPPRLKQLALRRLRETPQAVLHSDLLACDAFDISGQVADISTTAFVICGVEDRMTPVSEAQALSEMLRQARLEVMADAGHMPMLEQPLAFAALLQAYIFA